MREINIDPYENTPRDAVVTANNYPDGQHFALHTHQRGQFAYAACGVITVFSGQGNWVVPPQRAICRRTSPGGWRTNCRRGAPAPWP